MVVEVYQHPVIKAVSTKPEPTIAHRALVDLERAGYVYRIASQNYDDLFSMAGLPREKLSELHGNIYTETCQRCGTVFHRDYEVELATSIKHETGRNLRS